MLFNRFVLYGSPPYPCKKKCGGYLAAAEKKIGRIFFDGRHINTRTMYLVAAEYFSCNFKIIVWRIQDKNGFIYYM